MKLKTLTYEEAKLRHSKEVEQVVQTLRKSRSSHRMAPPESLVWAYICCTRGTAISFGDLLSDKVSPNRVTLSLEERVVDQVSRTETMLQATIGNWWGNQSIPNPPEVAEQARENLLQTRKERDAYIALPKAEKDRRFHEALKSVSGSGLVTLKAERRSPSSP